MAKTKESEISQIIRVLPDLWEFRFNEIKQKPEYRKAHTSNEFKPVGKYELNSFRYELNQLDIDVSTADIKCVIESSFVPVVNPVVDYFKELPPFNPALHASPISELCQTVKVKNTHKFQYYFNKWLVGVVANALDENWCRNHLCLVLSGEQGTFKTTWLENLCPKSLKQYMFTGKIDPKNKDVLTLIAENLFINIDDQLRQLNKNDENELKNLITVNRVKYRRPYDPYITEYPHLASFMASVNGLEFLTDVTGSRRFLPVEIESIDLEAAYTVNIDHVWAEAKHLLDQKMVYWLTPDEIDELNIYNKRFNVISVEEELVKEYFSLTGKNAYDQPQYLSTTAIKVHLEERTKQRLSSKILGGALQQNGFERTRKSIDGQIQWVYKVFPLNEDQILENRTKGVKMEVDQPI